MLSDCRDFRVDGLDSGTRNTGEPDGRSIALEGTELESSNLPSDVAGSFGIRKRLVCGSLLQTVGILRERSWYTDHTGCRQISTNRDLAEPSSGSSISQQTEDGVNYTVGVVQCQACPDSGQNGIVRVLCGVAIWSIFRCRVF